MTSLGHQQLVTFGDSLSDEGTFGFRFTTLPGHTWAHHVAQYLGCRADPAVECDYADAYLGRTQHVRRRADLNFAQGGARVCLPYAATSDEPWGIPWSVARQLDAYLETYGEFQGDHIAAVFAGTNDVAYRFDPDIDPFLATRLRDDGVVPRAIMDSEFRRCRLAATDLANLIARMRARSAPAVLVLGLFELSAAPWFRTSASRRYIRLLTDAYNGHLRRLLSDTADPHVQFIDTARVFAPILADPVAHGFRFGRGVDACRLDGADDLDFCDRDGQRTPTAHRDHVFAASVHLSTADHETLARHVIDTISRMR